MSADIEDFNFNGQIKVDGVPVSAGEVVSGDSGGQAIVLPISSVGSRRYFKPAANQTLVISVLASDDIIAVDLRNSGTSAFITLPSIAANFATLTKRVTVADEGWATSATKTITIRTADPDHLGPGEDNSIILSKAKACVTLYSTFDSSIGRWHIASLYEGE